MYRPNRHGAARSTVFSLLDDLAPAIPRAHNLDDLLSLLAAHHLKLRALRRGLIYLTDFAVDYRYPGESASKRQAGAAMRWADRVRSACRTLLGIRAPATAEAVAVTTEGMKAMESRLPRLCRDPIMME